MNNRVAKLLAVCGWNPLPVGLVAPLLFSLRAISEYDIVFHSAEFGEPWINEPPFQGVVASQFGAKGGST